jgi:ADP-ribose pyrophosphatase YjhB (NUDIX family)
MDLVKIGPRNSCKVIIINANQELLTIKKLDQNDTYYVLPGGGQHHGETFVETIKRECREEIGVEPLVEEEILFIREYIGKNHEFPSNHKHVHQIEYMFKGKIDKEILGVGTEEDEGQIGTEWIRIEELEKKNFYPKKLVSELKKYVKGSNDRVYLGDIN